ncbi:uncharacterized protein LACBIDRAFT_307230 [Laccaria bicolor S238N-H82]|uniref:Predicted protein n=1 Tax=Laccaria bicolor (strain S238N-H82 / ATCC MYA-4686) TaxID=486041 RepID=B0DPQ0_LACBS|nr:uncharacterized protein LACBIDRAFT_307230 [Laccaria bicolor S238N-H82]EDR03416.1 predicted protein [Laccaria bicolor S238N-H82]|eukprot:XP_001885872.1 predicted protein [Laccaria bicolor S238N-H82]
MAVPRVCTCGCWTVMVVGGCSHSSMVVIGGHSHSSILVVALWMLVGTCCRPSILVVGPHGYSSMVGVGPHRCSWAVIAIPQSWWWPIVDGRGGHLLCFMGVVRRDW